MTQLRLTMSGIVKNIRHFNAGEHPAVEFSLCRKNRGKKDEEATFTWARGIVFDPPEFMKIEKGTELTAVNGEVTLRSYKDKEGNDKVSLDAKYSSFDVQLHGQKQGAVENPTPAPTSPKKKHEIPSDDGDVPF